MYHNLLHLQNETAMYRGAFKKKHGGKKKLLILFFLSFFQIISLHPPTIFLSSYTVIAIMRLGYTPKRGPALFLNPE